MQTVGGGRGFVRKGTRSTAALIATSSPVQPAVSSHSVVTPPVALEASTRVPCECQVEQCSDTPPEGEDRPGREDRLQGGELGSEMEECRLIDNDRYTTAIDLVGLDADGLRRVMRHVGFTGVSSRDDAKRMRGKHMLYWEMLKVKMDAERASKAAPAGVGEIKG